MTMQEFEEKYYLHDSSIEKVSFDAEKKSSRSKLNSVSGGNLGTTNPSRQTV